LIVKRVKIILPLALFNIDGNAYSIVKRRTFKDETRWQQVNMQSSGTAVTVSCPVLRGVWLKNMKRC